MQGARVVPLHSSLGNKSEIPSQKLKKKLKQEKKTTPFKKWAKDMNRHLSKDIPVTKKHEKITQHH